MANNVTNTLTAVVTTQEDTTGNVPINRGTGNPALDVTSGEFTTYKKLASGDNIIQLPISPVCQVYVKNLDPTLVITVKGTLNGGASQPIAKLNPGDQVIVWNSSTGTTPGYTDITLNASGANALCEFFLGG